ncbi:MAG: hypothetical protein E7510_09210 [Ruminococcus sp.]|nr:hypothetical protein [Ruminococcus sp.]
MSLKKYYKKLIAAVTAVTMMFAATSCGESTSWIVEYGDQKVNAGVYIFYQTQAYNEAITKLTEEDENLDVADTKLLKTKTIENMNFTDWVNDQATQNVRIHLAVEKKFKELGLEIDEAKKKEINDQVDMMWSYYSEVYEQNGIGKESFKEIMEFDYMQTEVFNKCYDKGGEFEYSDNDIKAYLEGNYSRVKMIQLHLTDGASEELDDEGKKKIKEMADDYLKRAKAGEDFDALIEEYSEYRKKLEEEATAEEGTETTEEPAETTEATEGSTETEVTGESSTEEPAETTTVADNNEGTENEEAEEETTTVEGEEETQEAISAQAEEQAETSEGDAGAQENDAQSEEHLQAQNEDGESADNTVTEEATEETTEEANEEEVNEETTSETEESTETTGETTEESEETTEESTDETEEDPYANENIIYKGSEEEGYNPSQVVNEAIFDECVVNGDPIIVEDEEKLYIYVIQRLDILERDDFLEGEQRQGLLWEILEEEFKAKTLEWVTEEDLKKNNRAYKRYDPFNLKFD